MMEAVSGERFELVTIRSEGDLDRLTPLHKMAGQGVLASELQAALLADEVDVVVHSLRDLPLQISESAPLAAVSPRGSPADLLLGEECEVGDDLPPPGTRIGTSSPRRQSQLLALDRDLVPVDIRGNLDPRFLLKGANGLTTAVRRVLEEGARGPQIFNLGEGMPPEARLDRVESVVKEARAFRR